MSQYIGRIISLISSKGIRYVGTLSDVNGEEATVTLKNVKPFGTEGRIGGDKEILPVDEVYPIVVFRGSDVRDLSVLDDVPAPVADVAEPEVKEEKEEVEEEEVKEEEVKEERVYERRPVQNFASASVPDANFNFERAEVKDLQRDLDDTELSEPAYDKKKSFFDNISNSATEKYQRPYNRGNNRPDFGNKPDYGNNKPDFGNKPNYGNNRPDFGNKPDFGNRRGRGRGRGGYRGDTSTAKDYGAY